MTDQRQCLLVEDQLPQQIHTTEALHAAFPGIEVEVAASLKEARRWLKSAARAQGFSLAVIDLGLPDGSGVDLIAEIATDFPAVTSVVSSIYDDDHHLFDALSAGARGYLLKDQVNEMMVHYLRRIDQGEPPLSPSIARRLLSHFHIPSMRGQGSTEVALSGRETETLTLLAKGLTINEVAGLLNLSPTTIAGYVRVIYQKLDVSSRAQAVREAVRRGLA
ncbi:response regulator transcription factor [Asticcacaulis sp. DXS10W]|uniref:Response regulator transcription factor n=1 Tax=Asticcacaulis currens TaxID=2984210 RepID=A0ABT5I910_9CAUL|nr:response regulator transcription factor [Asticcacaulis currens]MDC7692660.1 response regulator transcription factor [Asticcacaulis currens]